MAGKPMLIRFLADFEYIRGVICLMFSYSVKD